MFSKAQNATIGRADGSMSIIPLATDILMQKGVGQPAHTRASGQYIADFENRLVKALDNGATFPGMRRAENLLLNSTDLSGWTKQNTATIDTIGDGSFRFNLGGTVDQGIYTNVPNGVVFNTGQAPLLSIELRSESISGTVKILDASGSMPAKTKIVTVSTAWQRFAIPYNGNITNGPLNIRIWISLLAGGLTSVLARNPQIKNVTNQTNTNPSEYISTGASTAASWFSYLNPYTVDANGVVTDSGVRTLITPAGAGILLEPGSTNKCTCYGVPRANAYGSTLSSGAATKGKVYEIVTRTSIDWNTVGTLLSGSANTVGSIYIITGTLTFTASDTGKEAIDYVGTKAYHDGTVFQNPITGMTLSGSDTLGTEILTNPNFDSNTVGWTAAACTLASVSGGQSGNCLELTATSTSAQAATVSHTTVVGTRYRMTCYVKSGTSGNEQAYLKALNVAYSVIAQSGVVTSATWQALTVEFNATETTTRFYLWKDTATLGTMLFDTASFKTISYPAVLSIVTDQTAIDAAKLAGITNGYKLYDLITGAGGAGNVDITGAMAAVITSMSCYARVISGSCVIGDSAGANTVTPSGSAYVLYKKENFTATAARTLRITASASSHIIFAIPCVEELPFATSIMPTLGATATRAVPSFTYPRSGNLPITGTRHVQLSWRPWGLATGSTQCLWSSKQDASNYVGVFASGNSSVYLEKMVAGASEKATLTITPVVGSDYLIDAIINADNTLQLMVNGTAAGTNTSTTLAPVLGSTCEVGGLGTANRMFGQIKTLKAFNL